MSWRLAGDSGMRVGDKASATRRRLAAGGDYVMPAMRNIAAAEPTVRVISAPDIKTAAHMPYWQNARQPPA